MLAQEPVVLRVLRRKLGSSAGGDSLRFLVDFLKPAAAAAAQGGGEGEEEDTSGGPREAASSTGANVAPQQVLRLASRQTGESFPRLAEKTFMIWS